MKSQFQVLTFLRQFKPSSELDRDIIQAFIEKRYRITPTTTVFSPLTVPNSIDVQSFTQWYENGVAPLEIAKFNDSTVMLGKCTPTEAEIIGKLEGDTMTSHSQLIPATDLSKPSPEETKQFLKAMAAANLQPNPTTLSLEAKYIPSPHEKILYHSYDFAINGIGVARSVDEESQRIELYCHYTYPTKTTEASLGYSMHEADIVNLAEYVFEPLLEDNDTSASRFSADDGVSVYRRLKRELEKAGKAWKDKIARIEPLETKAKQGERYYYISDKLDVVTGIERLTPSSHKRYLSGNYFLSLEAALIMSDRIREMIKDYLASPEWPKIK